MKESFKVRNRRFIARYLGFAVELIYKIRFKFLSFNKPPIIILTVGKVGSSSIYETLKKKTANKIFHVHNLSKEGIDNSVNYHLNTDRKSKPLHLIVSKYLSKSLSSYKGKVMLVTVIREPISREISSFFQNIEFYKNTLENRTLEIDAHKAHQILNQRLGSEICKIYEDWFKLELEDNYNIDVFSKPFDHEKKYMIFQNNNTNLLLLRMEDLNKVFPKAIQEFLSLQAPMDLQNANVGEQKYYADTYKMVKAQLKLDTDAINQVLNSKFFRHFYLNLKDHVVKTWAKNS